MGGITEEEGFEGRVFPGLGLGIGLGLEEEEEEG